MMSSKKAKASGSVNAPPRCSTTVNISWGGGGRPVTSTHGHTKPNKKTNERSSGVAIGCAFKTRQLQKLKLSRDGEKRRSACSDLGHQKTLGTCSFLVMTFDTPTKFHFTFFSFE
jgi:hypothetical protein